MQDDWILIKNKKISVLRDFSGIYITRENVKKKYFEIFESEPSEVELDQLMVNIRWAITRKSIGSLTEDKFKLVVL